MAFYGGISADSINANAQSALLQLRVALQRCTDIHKWLAAGSAADLVTAGIANTTDANDILSAFADADGLNQVFLTGTDSRNPGAGYVYANSTRAITGPLS